MGTSARNGPQAEQIVDQVFETVRPRIVSTVQTFLAAVVWPSSLYQFEAAVLLLVREIALLILQAAVQSLEPDNVTTMPKDLYFQCGGYRRRSARTANRSIATRFGNITL